MEEYYFARLTLLANRRVSLKSLAGLINDVNNCLRALFREILGKRSHPVAMIYGYRNNGTHDTTLMAKPIRVGGLSLNITCLFILQVPNLPVRSTTCTARIVKQKIAPPKIRFDGILSDVKRNFDTRDRFRSSLELSFKHPYRNTR